VVCSILINKFPRLLPKYEPQPNKFEHEYDLKPNYNEQIPEVNEDSDQVDPSDDFEPIRYFTSSMTDNELAWEDYHPNIIIICPPGIVFVDECDEFGDINDEITNEY
jgi:hypothetical protein